MSVALLLGAVVVFMVVMPLGAVAWSRAKHLQRPPVNSWIDVLHAEARRQRLTPVQIERVTAAVNRGTVAPEELQSITAQAASAKAAWLESALGAKQRMQRKTFIAVVILVAAIAVALALLIHQPGTAAFAAIEGVGAALVLRLTWGVQLRRARRAVQLNRAATD